MALSAEQNKQTSSANDGETSSGFKTFWKKHDKDARPQHFTFMEYDPSAIKSKELTIRESRQLRNELLTSRIEPNQSSRIHESGTEGSLQKNTEAFGAASGPKRRQQVYQAQKRHRNRKADFVNTLEAEVARLQHLGALVNNEKNSLAHQNAMMRELLASHSQECQTNALDLSTSSHISEYLNELSSTPDDIRFDTNTGAEQIFLDPSDIDMTWISDETARADKDVRRAKGMASKAKDTWAALDFIMALECSCKEHVHHHAINPHTTAL